MGGPYRVPIANVPGLELLDGYAIQDSSFLASSIHPFGCLVQVRITDTKMAFKPEGAEESCQRCDVSQFNSR